MTFAHCTSPGASRQRPAASPALRLLLCVFLAAATAACDDPYAGVQIYTIAVVGSVNPEPLPFAGSYRFESGGRAITRDLTSEGSFAATFEADALSYVRVVARQREGSYSLTVHRNGELIFDSNTLPASEPIVYTPAAADH